MMSLIIDVPESPVTLAIFVLPHSNVAVTAFSIKFASGLSGIGSLSKIVDFYVFMAITSSYLL